MAQTQPPPPARPRLLRPLQPSHTLSQFVLGRGCRHISTFKSWHWGQTWVGMVYSCVLARVHMMCTSVSMGLGSDTCTNVRLLIVCIVYLITSTFMYSIIDRSVFYSVLLCFLKQARVRETTQFYVDINACRLISFPPFAACQEILQYHGQSDKGFSIHYLISTKYRWRYNIWNDKETTSA